MFTGIILAIGKVADRKMSDNNCTLQIDSGRLALSAVALGDSIAVDGVCLTVIKLDSNCFWVDVSNETLAVTTLGLVKIGTAVNLELALTPASRLGGHIVSGHIDGLATLQNKQPDGNSFCLSFAAPDSLGKYIASKGSVCINGVSLTVNKVTTNTFAVNIIPHTQQTTTLGDVAVGVKVNLEVDLLARYAERLLQPNAHPPTPLTEELLHSKGFA